MRRRLKENKLNNHIEQLNRVNCPSCGSYMVYRKAKKGNNAGLEFYGCSTYPKCKATLSNSQNINPFLNLSYENLLKEENKLSQQNKRRQNLIEELTLDIKNEQLNDDDIQANELKGSIEEKIRNKAHSISTKIDSSGNRTKGWLFPVVSIALSIYFLNKVPINFDLWGFETLFYVFAGLLIAGIIFTILKFIFGFNEDAKKDALNLIQTETFELNEKLKEVNSLISNHGIEKRINNMNDEIDHLKNVIKKNNLTITYLDQLKRKAKERERTAKISAYEDKARTGTFSIKQQLLNVCSIKFKCAYCNNLTNKDDAEADHIYPIAKGGLTTLQNMVLICKKCNSSKSSNTLRVFSSKNNYDYLEICSRLEAMGKDV
jgi:5-methylcytosine-specific restriction endonuclease McrA